jgi:hypothetical protein
MTFIKTLIKFLNKMRSSSLDIPAAYPLIAFYLLPVLYFSSSARVFLILGVAITAIFYYIGKLRFNIFSKKVCDIVETMYKLNIHTSQDLEKQNPFILEVDIDIKKYFIEQLIKADFIKVISHDEIKKELKRRETETREGLLNNNNNSHFHTQKLVTISDALDNINKMAFPDYLKRYKDIVEKLLMVQIVDTENAYALYNSFLDDLFVIYVPWKQKKLFKEILTNYFDNHSKLNFSYGTLNDRDKQIELYTATLKTMATYVLSKSKKKKDILKYANNFDSVYSENDVTTAVIAKIDRSDFESTHYLKNVSGKKIYCFEIQFFNELLQKRFENKTLHSIFKDAYEKLGVKNDYNILSNSGTNDNILSSSYYIFPNGLNIAEITNKVQEEIESFYKSQQPVIYDYIKSNVREKLRS